MKIFDIGSNDGVAWLFHPGSFSFLPSVVVIFLVFALLLPFPLVLHSWQVSKKKRNLNKIRKYLKNLDTFYKLSAIDSFLAYWVIEVILIIGDCQRYLRHFRFCLYHCFGFFLQDVDVQEEFGLDLRAPLQGGCDGGREELPRPQASRIGRAQPTGHQDFDGKNPPKMKLLS